jgi:uncharacterized membrane protein YqiK
MEAKDKLLFHVRTAQANLSVLHGLAEASGDQQLIDAVNTHHRALAAARKDAIEVLGLADDADVAALSGGEDKPKDEEPQG